MNNGGNMRTQELVIIVEQHVAIGRGTKIWLNSY